MRDPIGQSLTFATVVLVAGGVITAASPRSALVVLQWVVTGLALVGMFYVVVVNAPKIWWTSPFDRPAEVADDGSGAGDDTTWIRGRFGGRRVRLGDGPVAVPPETIRLLRPLVREVLLRRQRDVGGKPLAIGVSALTRAIVESDPSIQAGWMGTLRPDERSVAEVVHHVLDDLEQFDATPPPTSHHLERGPNA